MENTGFDLDSISQPIHISEEERKAREFLRKEEYRLGIHIGYDHEVHDTSRYSSVYKTKQEWYRDCAIASECILNNKQIPREVEEKLLTTRKERWGEKA